MKYILLALILGCTTFANAQKIWDQESYTKLCDKQLSEVLAHTYELIIEGKLTAYWNDSFVTQLTIDEFKDRFTFELVAAFHDKRYPDDPYAFLDTVQIIYLNPKIDLKGFGLITKLSTNSIETSIYNTLGISLLFNYNSTGVNLGLNSLCYLKLLDIQNAFPKKELEILEAYIKTLKLLGNYSYLNYSNDSLPYFIEDLTSILSNRNEYQIQVSKKWQKAIASSWFKQYIFAAKMASKSGKIGYKDTNHTIPFNDLELALLDTFEIDMPENEWPEFVLYLDTPLTQQFNWQTEKISWFKSPNGEYVVGFKATKLWFYMKLEDILPYLPKEVLPSLEMLKKES